MKGELGETVGLAQIYKGITSKPVFKDIQAEVRLHLAEGFVARAYSISPHEFYLNGRGRAHVATARHLVMYLAHVQIGLSLAEIARRYSRDRSTAAYACRNIEDQREDNEFDGLVSEIEEMVSPPREWFQGRVLKYGNVKRNRNSARQKRKSRSRNHNLAPAGRAADETA